MSRRLAGISTILAVLMSTMMVFAQGYGDELEAHRLAFISERDNNLEIYVAHIERGLLVNATRHRASDSNQQWSPDGEWMYFSSGRDENTDYLLNTTTWEIRALPQAIGDADSVYRAVWSPDSTRLAFRSNGTDISVSNTIVFNFLIYHLAGGTVERIDTLEGWEFGGTSNMLDATDNTRRIIVRDIHGFPRFADIRAEDFRENGLVEALTFQEGTLNISPDGTQIVYADDSIGDMEIYLTDGQADSEPRNLSDHPSADLFPVWSADGRYIAFVSHRDGNSEIYVVDVDSGDLTNISNHSRRDYFPVFAP